MLNGKYPVLIFHIYNKAVATKISGLVNAPDWVEDFGSLVGVPIPFILTGNVPGVSGIGLSGMVPGVISTGIAVESETKSIDVATTVDNTLDQKSIVKQRPISSSVNVALLADRDSIYLTLLATLGDLVLKKCASDDYSITYMSGPVSILNGLLSRFSTMAGANDTLIRVDMTISTAKEDGESPSKKPTVNPIQKTAGDELGPNMALS